MNNLHQDGVFLFYFYCQTIQHQKGTNGFLVYRGKIFRITKYHVIKESESYNPELQHIALKCMVYNDQIPQYFLR